ncbi:MAG: patatin-like phospholipase family protein [Acidimicrobiales bacterium]
MADDTAHRSDPTGDEASTIRLSLTLPGSASLGAFQGGATAALAVVMNSLRSRGHTVHVDAVGGASAGSIVAMLFVHCLAAGRDASSMLRRAWVDEVDMDLLRTGGGGAPLAFDDLRSELIDFLDDTERHPYGVHEPIGSPISVHVGLTTLLGFTTPIVTGGTASSTLTYTDWLAFEVEPRSGREALTQPENGSMLDAVLVSASHPAAFAPRSLDRSADRDSYERRGITNFPPEGVVWYTDGGLVESEPVGRILEASRARTAVDDPSLRLHVVVDPRSSGPGAGRRWSDADADPSWLDGVTRALSVLPTQALHDDLRAISEVNERLEGLDDLMNDLRDRLGDDAGDVGRRIAELAGIADKEHVDVAVISPLLQADGSDAGVGELLAGDFVGAFGGFLDREIRRSDFALGWSCTRIWVDDHLEKRGVARDDVDAVLATLDAAGEMNSDDIVVSHDSVAELSWSGRWRLALLAMRVGHVLTREAIPSPAELVRRRRKPSR